MKDNIIGHQISFLRNKFRMTQEELASKIGVSKQTISNWETGLKTPRMGAIQNLAELFNVSKAFIIEGSTVEESTDLIFIIYNQLNARNKKEVIDFAELKLKEQEDENNLDAENEELLKEIDKFVEEHGLEAFETLHNIAKSKVHKDNHDSDVG